MDAIVEGQPIESATPWEAIADGEYAIVELFGHTTLVGRVTEIERFGAKMMAIEILFGGKLLAPIYHGGAAIYRMSPCSRETAWKRQHGETWQLPPAIRAVLPPELLPAPAPQVDLPNDDGFESYDDDDNEPF